MSTPIYDQLCQTMPGPSGSEEAEAVAAPGDEMTGATAANWQVSGGAAGNGQLGYHSNTADNGQVEDADSQADGKGAADGTVE
ncbi:MAG: hypothetical protein GEU83_04775 [Pseudonocardiaceae bacterium]|nr:hypothetical protein [Pseudonocardiaceae bacterium]